MFNGTLGVYPHKKVYIDIDPNAKPVHSRPYPVPRIHLKTFKKELDHLVRIGVLAAQQESEWASPSFIIQKKDGRVRWIGNLCQLHLLHVGWQNLFQLCCCVSGFWFWQEIGFGVTYVLRVQYSCGVVLVFWFWQEIVIGFAYVLSVQ